VLAGGGVAALEAALTLHDLAPAAADVTLVAVQDDFVVRAQAVGEPFGLGRARRVPLRTIARDTGARFRHGRVTGLDGHARLVLLDDDDPLPYDMVLLALGASPTVAYPAATTWRDDDPTALAGLARQARKGTDRSVVVVVPPGPAWLLPAYELAAMLARPAPGEVEVTLVTSEEHPLGAFGTTASTAVAVDLRRAGVRLVTGVHAEVLAGGRPTVVLHPGGRSLQPDRVITIPRLEGRRLPGVPADEDGFIPVDGRCAVRGLRRVWAAGDGIAFPLKHGGLAAAQGEVAAIAIAALAGADVVPRSWRPALRGVLVTGGGGARVLRSTAAGGDGDGSTSAEPLSRAPAKVTGRRLESYLAQHGTAWPRPHRQRRDAAPPASAAPGGAAPGAH
jgi:sulfide:quinone oxidoreductase